MGDIWLGRAWKERAKVIFLNTDMVANVNPEGWSPMNTKENLYALSLPLIYLFISTNFVHYIFYNCLIVYVQGRDLTTGNTLCGCMYLIDLEGSERVDKSEVTGDRLKEAQHINRSLTALRDAIASLAQKNAHVPYRNSKLPQLLQDSLGGRAKTLMFVHISPELDAVREIISTLKFAKRVAAVELGAAKLNKDSGDVKELKEQITSLKAALARKEGTSKHIQQHSLSSSPKDTE